MALFWEFFSLELKLRFKSLSTYVYFALWFCLAFLSIAAQDFLNTGNDKILLNGPFATSILYLMMSFFGMLVIAAIFGTSILRDFQRDTYQILFTKPINSDQIRTAVTKSGSFSEPEISVKVPWRPLQEEKKSRARQKEVRRACFNKVVIKRWRFR